MFKWLLSKWYKHSPTCNCGWAMKPFEKKYFDFYWKCVWPQCKWETYQGSNGKLHWWK